MTKVTGVFKLGCRLLILCVAFCAVPLFAADSPAEQAPAANPAASLYQQLSSVGLDKQRIFHVRAASLDRSSLHFTLDDGTIAFTEDVAGHITGAIFAGQGETLLVPPNQMERGSMVLFTGEAILEEQFETAYFRFNDDTFTALQPFLRPEENVSDFYARWNETAKDLSQTDALRIFMTLSEELPGADSSANSSGTHANSSATKDKDDYFHAHLQGLKLGGFDIYYDTRASEQIWAGQLRTVKTQNFYDVWTSFSPKAAAQSSEAVSSTTGESGPASAIKISSYQIRAEVKPPTELSAEANLQLQVTHGGMRTVLFELSRVLRIKDVQVDGRSVEFIHNQSLEGTQLARRGNDVVAVVFPAPLQTGQQLQLKFNYNGEVISQAGPGLLYVGERGNWYPNLGMAMSNFDLEFHYPVSWTLLATGKQVAVDATSKKTDGDPVTQEQVSRWVSPKAIPFAGFNLGKYARGTATAHDIPIEAYATNAVEKNFPKVQQPGITAPVPFFNKQPLDLVPFGAKPVPAKNVQNVAESAARAVDFFSTVYGPYPFSSLTITQMPGYASQGWPGMIFLSTYAFLTDEEKAQIQYSPVERTMIDMTVAHETAHQWWGDLVGWNSYRDQWLLEALANYSSALLLKEQNPAEFRAVLDKYRDDLLVKQEDGGHLMDAGPVTLGVRLSSSKFPLGYEAISYGRGTWLFFMLHSMIKDGTQLSAHRVLPEDPFLKTMLRIRDEYADKTISTRELMKEFETDMPPSLRYEGRKSLDWFYDSWINGSSIPRFELSKVKFSEVNGKTVVTGSITEKDAADDLITPVPVYALLPRKVLIGQVFVDEHEVQFRLTAPAGTKKIVLDPDHTLLTRPE